MAIYYSPTGNPEVWREGTAPAGYVSADEWRKAHPAPQPPAPTPEEIIAEYDAALEHKLAGEKTARGYTVREPSDYAQSNVIRYRSDAIDWAAHRDAVMLAGLQMLNRYKQTGVIPSLSDFLHELPDITWSIDPRNENPAEGMSIE